MEKLLNNIKRISPFMKSQKSVKFQNNHFIVEKDLTSKDLEKVMSFIKEKFYFKIKNNTPISIDDIKLMIKNPHQATVLFLIMANIKSDDRSIFKLYDGQLKPQGVEIKKLSIQFFGVDKAGTAGAGTAKKIETETTETETTETETAKKTEIETETANIKASDKVKKTNKKQNDIPKVAVTDNK